MAILVSAWVASSAAVFHHLERQNDRQLVLDVTTRRNQLVANLATELRQVFPYEMAWRRKIDDYLTRFEQILANATLRGYSVAANSSHHAACCQWSYADALLFCFQLVTGQGSILFQPK